MTKMGIQMHELQKSLSDIYGYKPLPQPVADDAMRQYLENLPDRFKNNITNNTIGYSVEGQNILLNSSPNFTIATKYDRIVIGHYGAFIEIDNNDIVRQNLKIQEGQEFRLYNNHVKYIWLTPKDNSKCKLYYQKRTVPYADYQIGKWYISPYEVEQWI